MSQETVRQLRALIAQYRNLELGSTLLINQIEDVLDSTEGE